MSLTGEFSQITQLLLDWLPVLILTALLHKLYILRCQFLGHKFSLYDDRLNVYYCERCGQLQQDVTTGEMLL